MRQRCVRGLYLPTVPVRVPIRFLIASSKSMVNVLPMRALVCAFTAQRSRHGSRAESDDWWSLARACSARAATASAFLFSFCARCLSSCACWCSSRACWCSSRAESDDWWSLARACSARAATASAFLFSFCARCLSSCACWCHSLNSASRARSFALMGAARAWPAVDHAACASETRRLLTFRGSRTGSSPSGGPNA